MGKFLIFIGVTLLLIAIGLGVWWLGNLIYIKVQRENEKFEVEKEGYGIAKDQIIPLCLSKKSKKDMSEWSIPTVKVFRTKLSMPVCTL